MATGVTCGIMGTMDDPTDPIAVLPRWERRCFRISMAGWAAELLALVMWPFAPHGNGWAFVSLGGIVVFVAGVAAAAVMQRVTTGRDRSAGRIDASSDAVSR